MSLGRSGDGRLFTRDGKLCVGCCGGDEPPIPCAFPFPACINMFHSFGPCQFLMGGADTAWRVTWRVVRASANGTKTTYPVPGSGNDPFTTSFDISLIQSQAMSAVMSYSWAGGYGTVPPNKAVICDFDLPPSSVSVDVVDFFESYSGVAVVTPAQPLVGDGRLATGGLWSTATGPSGETVYWFNADNQNLSIPNQLAIAARRMVSQRGTAGAGPIDTPFSTNTQTGSDVYRVAIKALQAAEVAFSQAIQVGSCQWSRSTTFTGFDDNENPTYSNGFPFDITLAAFGAGLPSVQVTPGNFPYGGSYSNTASGSVGRSGNSLFMEYTESGSGVKNDEIGFTGEQYLAEEGSWSYDARVEVTVDPVGPCSG